MNLLQFQLTMLQNIYADNLQDTHHIYFNNTHIALSHHLEMVYPVCCQWVGKQFFKKACFEYVQQYYLAEYDLTFYGAFFSDHLANIIAHKLPKNANINGALDCLPDLAKWEWAIHQAQCGPNHVNVFYSQTKIMHLNLEEKDIISPKSSSLIQSNYPIEKIWTLHQSNEVHNDHGEFILEPGRYYWWIGLVDNQLRKDVISQSTFLLLSEIKHRGILSALEWVADKGLEINAMNDLVTSLKKGRLILL